MPTVSFLIMVSPLSDLSGNEDLTEILVVAKLSVKF